MRRSLAPLPFLLPQGKVERESRSWQCAGATL